MRQSHLHHFGNLPNPGSVTVGRRLYALPFRWSLPLSVAWNCLIYLSAPTSKTLRIARVGEEHKPAEPAGLPRRLGCKSNLWGYYVAVRGGADSYCGRNPRGRKARQESGVVLGHPAKSCQADWRGPGRPPRSWSRGEQGETSGSRAIRVCRSPLPSPPDSGGPPGTPSRFQRRAAWV
jgi:hypothetical protein